VELIDFSKNEDSISKQANIDSVLLYGNPDAEPEAKITICIPTYKRPRLLKEAIESAINQVTNIPYRIIVVDNDPDFSNMEVLDIIKSLNQGNLSYYKNRENLMLYGNLNRCIVLAKTKWAAFLHDDDLLLKNYIETVSGILYTDKNKIKALRVGDDDEQNNPYMSPGSKGYEFLKKMYHLFQRAMIRKKIVKMPLIANLFINIYGAPTCGMVFDRQCFVESGGFNENYYPNADSLFCIFFSLRYNFYFCKQVLGIHRWEDNESLKERFISIRSLSIKRKHISLIEYSKFNCLIYRILKKDFHSIVEANIYERPKLSMLYYFIKSVVLLPYFFEK
jgi:glycosyltransferase involved in cell wall biosynthesis